MLIYIYFAHNKELNRSRHRRRRRKCECALYTINTPTTNILKKKKKKASNLLLLEELLPIATRTTLVCFFILSLKRDAKVTPKLPLHWVYQVVVKPLLTTNNWKWCFAQNLSVPLSSLMFLQILPLSHAMNFLLWRSMLVIQKITGTRTQILYACSLFTVRESSGTNFQSNLY